MKPEPRCAGRLELLGATFQCDLPAAHLPADVHQVTLRWHALLDQPSVTQLVSRTPVGPGIVDTEATDTEAVGR